MSGDAFYEVLRTHNRITTIFGNPGSSEMPQPRDFPGDFTHVLALHSGVDMGMAEEGFAHAARWHPISLA
jgi:benzoylformate decarboxylase